MPWIVTPRTSRFFDLHSQECWDEGPAKTDAGDWIAVNAERFPDVPVYCEPTRMGAYKHAVEYPVQDVMASLPIAFLENSVAYMIALAIYEKVDRIGLYGIHMVGGREYAYERPSITYLVGLAQGRGIAVDIPPGSPLFISDFKAGRYGQAGGRRF